MEVRILFLFYHFSFTNKIFLVCENQCVAPDLLCLVSEKELCFPVWHSLCITYPGSTVIIKHSRIVCVVLLLVGGFVFFCFNTGFSRKLFWVVFAFTSFTEPSKRVGNLIKKQSFKGNLVVRCNRTRRVLTAVELQWINKYSLCCSCCRQEKIPTKSASVQVADNPTALGVNLCCSVCKSCYPELCQSYL